MLTEIKWKEKQGGNTGWYKWSNFSKPQQELWTNKIMKIFKTIRQLHKKWGKETQEMKKYNSEAEEKTFF